MSLINQMLKDLDSRKPQPSAQASLPLNHISPNVPLLEVEAPLIPSWLLYGTAVLGLGLSLFAGWRFLLPYSGIKFNQPQIAQVSATPDAADKAQARSAANAALPKPGPEPPAPVTAAPSAASTQPVALQPAQVVAQAPTLEATAPVTPSPKEAAVLPQASVQAPPTAPPPPVAAKASPPTVAQTPTPTATAPTPAKVVPSVAAAIPAAPSMAPIIAPPVESVAPVVSAPAPTRPPMAVAQIPVEPMVQATTPPLPKAQKPAQPRIAEPEPAAQPLVMPPPTKAKPIAPPIVATLPSEESTATTAYPETVPPAPRRIYRDRSGYSMPTVVTGEKSADQLYQEGARHWDAGDKIRARDFLERALRIEPTHRGARQLLAKSHAAAGNLELARELLNGSPDASRSSESAKLNVQILLQQGNLEHAERILEPWMTSGDPEFIGLMGALRQQQGRYRESLEYYQQAAQLQPKHSKWMLGLAIALEASERFEEAERAYKQALTLGVLSADAQAYIMGRLAVLGNNR